jgi:ATP-dependent Lon protease
MKVKYSTKNISPVGIMVGMAYTIIGGSLLLMGVSFSRVGITATFRSAGFRNGGA